MASREISIPFPAGGIDATRGYRTSDPQTTRFARNITPDAGLDSRTRGGSRPGLSKRYSTPVDGIPLYMERVSAGDDTRVYEHLVVGTIQNAFVGKSTASGTVPPITYSESLSPLSGELTTEQGVVITTEQGVPIIVNDFDLSDVSVTTVVSYKGRLIIGSNGQEIVAGSGSVSGTALTDGAVPDFEALGVDPGVHWVEVREGTDVVPGTYLIDSVSGGTVTLASDPTTSPGAKSIEYAIVTGVRVLDTEASTLTLMTPSGGFIPTGASAVAVYLDRLVWAVGRNWYMSRQGDPGDYDYGADPEDPARAIAGNASDAGQPADPIVAMAGVGYDYLIFFAESAIWVMRGDPGYGGRLYNLSRTLGCVSQKAWCYGQNVDIFFLSKEGLCHLPSGASEPEQLSPERMPREMKRIDRDNYYISLAYDPLDRGVLVFATPRDATRGNHWWFDLDTTSFWPVRFGSNSQQPLHALTFGGAPTRSRRVVLACFDGYIREWFGQNDDGTPIQSSLVLGPYELATQDDADAVLTELVTMISPINGTVTVKVYAGSDSETVSQAAMDDTPPSFSTTVGSGRSFTMRPRIRGVALCLRLDSTDQWAMDGITGRASDAGRRRL